MDSMHTLEVVGPMEIARGTKVQSLQEEIPWERRGGHLEDIPKFR